MKLEEMNKKVLKMIEEVSEDTTKLTDDPDIDKKLNEINNQIMYELARYKKIPAYIEFDVKKDDFKSFSDLEKITGDKIYQIDIIKGVDSDIRNKYVLFNEDGLAKIHYFRYPVRITEENKNNYEFELDEDALEIMPYGVAGDALKSDVSNNYGQIYSNRYRELLQGLDPRSTVQSATFEGGYDI